MVSQASTFARPLIESERNLCPLCGREEFDIVHRRCPDRLLWLPGEFDIERCVCCGLMRTSPCPDARSIARYYPEEYGHVCAATGANRGVAGRALRAAVRIPYALRYGPLSRTPSPSVDANRILDIGCAEGDYLVAMVRLGWHPWGIELRGASADVARARLGVPDGQIFVGRVEDAEFASNSFDLVTMAHVLEHLENPVAALGKIHRWLSPRGRLRIWLPNVASLEGRAFGRLWHGLDVPRHLFHFSPETIRRALETSGFSIERIVPEFGASSLSLSFTHLFNSMLGRRRRPSVRLTYGLLPLTSLLSAFGYAATLDVTAKRL
jgi:2-polyprenyl-3-methyl-5-hydroxy-6-metoxy-1,4-benzoquinol methylase